MTRRALGLDLGGSKLLAALVSEDGSIVAKTTRTTGRDTPPARAIDLIKECASELGPFDAIGLGFPGLCDLRRGLVRSSIMLDGWRDNAFAMELEAAFARPAVVDNDVNMALVAELHARENAGGATVFLAIGTGIGGAIAFDRRVWRGASGVAGELGNMTIDKHGARCWCGRRGCLNTLASGSALERVELESVADALSEGISDVINLLNPTLVVLGGGVIAYHPAIVARAGELVKTKAFAEATAVCAIEAARAGYEAGAVGAALLAMEARPC